MAGCPFAGMALKGLEPYAGKLARTVLSLGGVSYPVLQV